MIDEVKCSKCGQAALSEQLMPIETETNIYYYCISCVREAEALMSMKIFINKDERALLKQLRKFIKKGKAN
jgi:hypothetical protein